MSLFNKQSLRPVFGISFDDLNPMNLLEGGDTTTTQSNTFNPTVKPLAEDAVAGLQKTTTPTYFPGATVAGQSGNTLSGIRNLSGAAGTQQGVSNQALGGYDFTLNQMLDPNSNQALQAYMQGAINPIFDRLENQTLPGIGGNAIQAGQFGGTAQTNLTRDALTDATRNAGDITSNIAANAYQSSLDNYTNTLLNSGRFQDFAATPAQTQLAAGGLQDAYSQQLINADIDRYNYGQTADLDYWSQIMNVVNAVPQDSTQVQTGGGTSPFNALLAGYGAYNMFA